MLIEYFEIRTWRLGEVLTTPLRKKHILRIIHKLHNEELNDLYSLPNIVRVVKSRRMRWAGHVARMGEDRGVHRMLVGKPEGKRPLGRPRRRWEDYINPYPANVENMVSS